MFLAVPSTMLAAASTVYAFKSGIFICAISNNFARLIVATLFFFALSEPLETPAAFFNKSDAGGVFVIKVKVRSS